MTLASPDPYAKAARVANKMREALDAGLDWRDTFKPPRYKRKGSRVPPGAMPLPLEGDTEPERRGAYGVDG